MPLVLVIEDEIGVLRSLEEGLRAADFDVATATTGSMGLHMATSRVYDCIVLDWMLRGADRVAAIRRTRLLAGSQSVSAGRQNSKLHRRHYR